MVISYEIVVLFTVSNFSLGKCFRHTMLKTCRKDD